MVKVGDYVVPIMEEEDYKDFLEVHNINYQDLFGIVTNVKNMASIDKPRYSISVRSLVTGEVSENWNPDLFQTVPVPENMKDRYEYMLHTNENIGTFRI